MHIVTACAVDDPADFGPDEAITFRKAAPRSSTGGSGSGSRTISVIGRPSNSDDAAHQLMVERQDADKKWPWTAANPLSS
jgi:hypothetical protein